MWSMKRVPVVIGASGAVSRKLEECIERLGIDTETEHLQKTALLRTANILRKMLEN